MYRFAFRRIVLLYLISPIATAAAGDCPAALPIGTKVLAKRPGVHFRIGSEDGGEMCAGMILHVHKVQGDWIWLGRGWVQQRDVVPEKQWAGYFTREIERRPTAFAYLARAAAASADEAPADQVDRDIDKALELDPDFAPAYLERASRLNAQKDFGGAIDACDDALRLDPTFADAYSWRGLAWIGNGRKDKALKDFDRAIRLCPRLGWAYTQRGSLLLQIDGKGDREKALRAAQEALKHDPISPFAHTLMGRYWLAQNDDDRAIAAYSKALESDPCCAEAHLERGKLYSRQGDFEKALVDLNRAVELSPKDAGALEARGYVYYRLDATEKSLADRLAAERLRPSSKAESNSQAEKDKQKTTDKDSTGTAASSTAAKPAESSTAKSVAADLNRSARRQATSTDERYLNGPAAVELATKACEKTDWTKADFIDTLAAAYAECGDFESAVKWQTKAIELAGSNATFRAAADERLELYRQGKPYREDAFTRMTRVANPDQTR